MLLTEKEAQARWCPYGRQVALMGSTKDKDGTIVGMPVSFNRQPNGDVPSCLGSLCMAWRWARPNKVREIDLTTGELIDDGPRKGYCGAFGRPDIGD